MAKKKGDDPFGNRDESGPFDSYGEPPQSVAGVTGDGKQVATDDDGNNVSFDNGTGDGDPYGTDAMLMEILQLYKDTDAKNRKAIEDFLGTSGAALEQAVKAASIGDEQALNDFKRTMSDFKELEAGEYGGDAYSSAEDLARQQEAYDRQVGAADAFKPLMGTKLTASERYILESNRRNEEQDRRAALDAALADLGARGARSGGADITAMLGAQQQTSQNRSIADLGALASAQERSMAATRGYADANALAAGTATSMRNSGDVMARFNQGLAQDWAQWSKQFQADQQDAAVGRAKDILTAETGVNQAQYGRAGDLYGAGERGVAMLVGSNNQGAQNMSQGFGGFIAADQAQQAIDATKVDDSWSIGDPILLDKIINGIGL